MPGFRRTAALLPGIAIVLCVSAERVAADEVRGVVAGVDLGKNELRVDGRGAARGTKLTFALDDKTLVLFGSEKAAATDLSPGRHVRIEYEADRDGTRIARVVRVNGRPPAAARTVPAAPPVPPVAATPGEAPPGGTAPGDAINGVLQRVARADREIVIVGPGSKGPETETTVAVPESAKVAKEGKPSSLEALNEGDAVAVRVERRDGKLTALEVQAGPGAALSATAAPTPERGRMVPRLRQALHLADEVLRRIDPDDAPRRDPQKP